MRFDTANDTARALGHIAWRDYTGLDRSRSWDDDLIVYGERRSLVVDYKG